MNETHRRQWCMAVAKLVYPIDPPRCVKALVDYLPMFHDLPDEAFNPLSAEEVALAERRMAFPSYDEVAKPLRAWWKANRPPSSYPRLAGPGYVPEPPKLPPTPEEIAYVEARVAEVVNAVKQTQNRPGAVKSAYVTPSQLRAMYRRDKRTDMMPPWLREEGT